MKILFIDDETELLRQAEIFLEKEDERLEVDTASSAEKGLVMFDEEEYDAVVSDYKMSDMDGFDFLETIRRDRKNDVPFIIFTGRGCEEVAMEALNLGADRYVMKGGDVRLQFEDLADAIFEEVYPNPEKSKTNGTPSDEDEG